MRPRTRFLLLCAAIVFGRYQRTLTITDRGAATTERRIVTDELALEKREKSDDAEMYRTLQYLVNNKQNALVKELNAMDEIFLSDNELARWTFGWDDFTNFVNWSVTIIQDEEGSGAFIVLSDDFSVAKNAGLLVLLSKKPSYTEKSTLRLWPIVSLTWRQIYKVSLEEMEEYSESVILWSSAFETLLSLADLNRKE